jgi:L,D-peptidoglycan transpeptidase YkuD (ErfK/YbiS/YcfS/YnhG family)
MQKIIVTLMAVFFSFQLWADNFSAERLTRVRSGSRENVSQLLWVKASNDVTSVAQLWEYKEGQWQSVGDEFDVSVGTKGTTKSKREGDGETPEGIFSLNELFGRGARQNLKMSYRALTAADKWIDDAEHADYNTFVQGATTARSYEDLLREDGQYDLFAVVGYNMNPIIPGNGSAIFVHIWSGPGNPTAGCVAMERENMERLARFLDREKNPHILIGELRR